MKHLKLFFALFAMLALGVTNAWGAENVTITKTTNTLVSELGWSVSSGSTCAGCYTEFQLDEAITISTTGTPNCGSIWGTTTNDWRLYQTQNGNVIVSAKEGYELVSIKLTYSPNKNGTLKDGSTTINSNAVVSCSGLKTKTLTVGNTSTNTNGQVRITTFSVTYVQTAGSGSSPVTPAQLPAPTGLTVDDITSSGATLSWNAVANASNYSVTINGNNATATTNSYNATGLTAGTEYTWSVVANGDGTNYTDSDAAQHTFTTTAATTPDPGTGGTGTINFNSSAVKINAASVTGNDDLGNTWTITTVGTTSYTASNAYYQVGSGSKPATSITFTTTLPSDVNVTAFSAKFGGFSGTAGTVTLKVDDTSVGTGSLNATSDVTISNSSQATGKKLTVTVTGIAKGVKVYYISYTYTTSSGGSEQETPAKELSDAQFAWSAATAEATMGASNTFPTLTNTLPVTVTYESSNTDAATIAANGDITLVAPGTTTISAKFAGGEVSGTTYAPKTVTYALKVNAQPTGTMYVKVTDAVTDGEYLIVYEDGKVAFNGALTTLDAVGNTIEVEINSNTIAGNTEIDAATFTIASMTGGHSIQSKSGTYIGRTASGNGMNTGSSAILNIISITGGAVKVAGSGSGASASLQYYTQSGSERFRYYTSAQKAIALYKKVDPNAVVEPVFTPVAGEYYGTQSVTISCATAGAEVYYTLDGPDPTSTSTKYTGAISIASTTTIKAVAIKGENSSAVVSATYTILAPLTTMQAIFDKATAVGGTATPVHITMNNWVVTGVKNNNVYVTDGTKGLIIYTASHGFNVGDMLSGTVACKVQLYDGSSELTELTSTTEGLTVSTGGVVTPVVVNDVTTLGGVNTGSVIKITGPCTVDGTKYYVAGVQLYNSLYTYTNPENGYNYECTGVYLQYNTTKEILPRKAEDLVKIETQQPAGISFAVTELTAEVGATDFEEPELTNPNSLTVTYKTSDETLATVDATTGEVTIGNKEGKVTITASFAGSDDYVAANASYNITITDPSVSSVTFDAAVDIPTEGLILTKDGISMEFTAGTMNNGEEYRCNASNTMTISYTDGFITKVVLNCLANGTTKYGPGCFTTTIGSYSYEEKVGTWTGEAKSVVFTSGQQVRMTTVTVYYKQDKRANSELAWSEETVNLTVGEIFTAPTFSNPNGLDLTDITFTSDNTALATVNNAGAISLVSGKTGTATITATFAGDATYKAAEVTCVITVSPKTENVVILAEYNGQWYALKAETGSSTNSLAALKVEYINGVLYNVDEADKASITWKRTIVGNFETFQYGDKYLKGSSSTNLFMEDGTEGKYQWDKDTHTMLIGSTNRTFLYQGTYFKNYAISNAGRTVDGTTYSALPVVTAAKFETASFYTRTVTPGNYGTICLPYAVNNFTGATFYEVAGKEGSKIVFDEVTKLEAGKPYIFMAEAAEIKLAQVGDAAIEAGNHNSLQGTFEDITDGDADAVGNILEGNYMVVNNVIKMCGARCKLPENRAYFVAEKLENLTPAPASMPGRRRVTMGVTGENEATGVDNITENGVIAPKKYIENGQLVIIRGGEKFNAQGQKL